jgi:hypothetical protein
MTMTDDAFPRPSFNHVGFSVSRDVLDEAGRKRIVAFFEGVFGFTERASWTKDRELLILTQGGPDQLIVFFGSDSPTSATPPTDHFGMRCNSLDQLKVYLGRVRERVAADSSIEFEDYSVSLMEDMPPRHNLHKFYVRVGTPFAFEVQFYEWLGGDLEADGAERRSAVTA